MNINELILAAAKRNVTAYHFAGNEEISAGWYAASVDSSIYLGHEEGEDPCGTEREVLTNIVSFMEVEDEAAQPWEIEGEGITQSPETLALIPPR